MKSHSIEKLEKLQRAYVISRTKAIESGYKEEDVLIRDACFSALQRYTVTLAEKLGDRVKASILDSAGENCIPWHEIMYVMIENFPAFEKAYQLCYASHTEED